MNELEINNVHTTLEFKDVPEFLNISNQSLNYSSENLDRGLNSEILFPTDKNIYIKKKFSIKMNIPEIVDWVRTK